MRHILGLNPFSSAFKTTKLSILIPLRIYTREWLSCSHLSLSFPPESARLDLKKGIAVGLILATGYSIGILFWHFFIRCFVVRIRSFAIVTTEASTCIALMTKQVYLLPWWLLERNKFFHYSAHPARVDPCHIHASILVFLEPFPTLRRPEIRLHNSTLNDWL